ncbi:MAG: DNA polymerase II large subunit [archaeon]
METYFSNIQKELDSAHALAKQARQRGYDPEKHVDIVLAKNMAERVEGLISTVAPQLKGTRMTERIQELEETYGALSWEVGLKIAEEVARQEFCTFSSQKEAMEIGIRVGFAYHTVGIVSAPLEGFIELVLKRTKEGKEYFSIKFAGPIRGAGGTAASYCVILSDYIRHKFGFAAYDPSENEISRFITELQDYHERVTNLQYNPSPEELRFLIANVPVEVDGDPSEVFEVSNYKDLPRVETNRIRSGVCLVVSMIALKAPKIWKRLKKLGKDFDLEWTFLEEFLKIQKKVKAKQEKSTSEGSKLTPNHTYIADLVAGRPVLSNPMARGGFRLRYGRARISGFSAACIHPALSFILNSYIATGTQLKVERPGKATAVTFCDSIQGPVVLLKDDSVVELSDVELAKQLSTKVKEILQLGDILFCYGDFSENGHFLCPVGYCEEWYGQELIKAIESKHGNRDIAAAAADVGIPASALTLLVENPLLTKLSFRASMALSRSLALPLHPTHTYHWTALMPADLQLLSTWIRKHTTVPMTRPQELVLPLDGECKFVLENLAMPHGMRAQQVVFSPDVAASLLLCLGLYGDKAKDCGIIDGEDVLAMVNRLAGIPIRDKSGTFIGARMGRPEKAKQRKMAGSPHVLFPVGEEGGRLRSFQAALEVGKVTADFPLFVCPSCQTETVYSVCDACGSDAEQQESTESDANNGRYYSSNGPRSYSNRAIPISRYFSSATKLLDMKMYPDLIKGVRGTSNKDHRPEHLAKGLLRAKHDIYVNKDGTTRYDMSEIPITHFKPAEIGTTVETLIGLGYTHDAKGNPLISSDQVIELKCQDLILPGQSYTDQSADAVLLNVSRFVDELLEKFYRVPPFYNATGPEDLVGQLVICLSPHTSAGIVGRVIGFSRTQGMFAHPLMHAAMRRDCDGDEACVMLLMDGLLNFSRQYLPDKRGAKTMDAPLVLTTKLVPSEVDDMVLGMDIAWKYKLELYEAAEKMKNPWDVKVEQVGAYIGTERQYEHMGYTHEVSDLNIGVVTSAYKTLPSMEEKLKGQMELAEKIRAVSASAVAALVIEKHFLKDTKGNLRKFSQQQFRCVNCNEKFRRPPLIGRCTNCQGRLIFTVSEGSVIKYLEPSISLAEKYDVPAYLKQTLNLVKRRVESVFGKDKERQEGLGKWFG